MSSSDDPALFRDDRSRRLLPFVLLIAGTALVLVVIGSVILFVVAAPVREVREIAHALHALNEHRTPDLGPMEHDVGFLLSYPRSRLVDHGRRSECEADNASGDPPATTRVYTVVDASNASVLQFYARKLPRLGWSPLPASDPRRPLFSEAAYTKQIGSMTTSLGISTRSRHRGPTLEIDVIAEVRCSELPD